MTLFTKLVLTIAGCITALAFLFRGPALGFRAFTAMSTFVVMALVCRWVFVQFSGAGASRRANAGESRPRGGKNVSKNA